VSLVLSLLVAYLLLEIQLVLILLILAIIFATLIERPVEILQERRLPRPLSILLIYITIFAGIFLFSMSVAPVIREQAAVFRQQAPVQIQDLEQTWQESSNPILNGVGRDALLRVIEFIDQPATEIPVPEGAANVVIGLATGVGGGVIGLLTTLVIAFYYLMEKNWLRQLLLEQLKPSNRDHVARIIDSVETKVGDWMRGQLVLMLVIGVCATVAYGLLGIRFWPLLGLWAGLTEVIPIVGPWLGGIPAVIMALTQGWDKAILTVGVIVLLQSLENYVLVPRVMRGAVGLSPMTVFLAILAGTQFLGILGAVLAIPVAAAVQVLLNDFFRARREEYLAEAPAALTSWHWMRGQRAATPDGGAVQVSAGDETASGQQRPAPARTPAKRRGWSRALPSRPPKENSDE
jgi:predicted PurR-regulated permease PerM